MPSLENEYVNHLFDGCDADDREWMIKDVFKYIKIQIMETIIGGYNEFLYFENDFKEEIPKEKLIDFFENYVDLTEDDKKIVSKLIKNDYYREE